MVLIFVGLGVWDEKDISLRGLEAVRNADIVFAEFYTSPLAGRRTERMEKIYGRKIIVLKREDIEENDFILEHAKEKNVVLLSAGDPMIATTHVDLMLRAVENGIKTEIIHASSVYSAVAGACGLQIYKFGRSATVSPPFRDVISEVPYETVIENRKRGLHTLLFLDIDMSIGYALNLLEEIERRRMSSEMDAEMDYEIDDELVKSGDRNEDDCDMRVGGMIGGISDVLFVGIARVGASDQVVKADYIDALRTYDFGDPPHILVAVGNLHFMEKEALIKLADAPLL